MHLCPERLCLGGDYYTAQCSVLGRDLIRTSDLKSKRVRRDYMDHPLKNFKEDAKSLKRLGIEDDYTELYQLREEISSYVPL